MKKSTFISYKIIFLFVAISCLLITLTPVIGYAYGVLDMLDNTKDFIEDGSCAIFDPASHNCIDINHDGFCDHPCCRKQLIGAITSHVHTDRDNDHYCDYRNCSSLVHKDLNFNHVCDYTGCSETVHSSSNKDHKCDNCDAIVHFDENKNGICDADGCWFVTNFGLFSSEYMGGGDFMIYPLIFVGADADRMNEVTKYSKNKIALGCSGGPLDPTIEALVAQYNEADFANFSCSAKDGYKPIMASYQYVKEFRYRGTLSLGNNNRKGIVLQTMHTQIYTNLDLEASDLQFDLDGGRFVVSNMMNDDIVAWNHIFSNLKTIIVGITGIATLACILGFVIQIVKLGLAADNPVERERAVKGLLWTGIGTAGLGAATLIFGMFFNIL
jgi:hypothetical protein